ncbi:hypothetical protein GCM10014715_86830 [Streptomyces spiralis]|uniref:Uncharacterized protein n=1 Tax=Streptomyces spiralis TaxID=66376 RepID=A0A919E702_9ACTN|nr:hypothetical protein [Streptomyces spiralis]GHF18544.1 hypothetical protein GCM10014715_86830 [Streptomyces spiralis]
MRRLAASAAVLGAVLAMAWGPPAAADGSGQVTLRLETPAVFHMYSADEGASASISDFPVPVHVVPSDGGQARNVKVVVSTVRRARCSKSGR